MSECGQSMTPRTIGHYFEFKRGTWVVDASGEKKQHHSDSGLSYVGSLTEAGKLGLDELISEYVAKEGAKTREETDDVCAHRHYKTHCRICRIAKLESSLAEAVAALKVVASVMERYESSDHDGESYNNNDVIAAVETARAIIAKHSG